MHHPDSFSKGQTLKWDDRIELTKKEETSQQCLVEVSLLEENRCPQPARLPLVSVL